jgi:ornithine cyclodeaminase/alanine dehydrogenase-like protein (mu-crystallin family)
MSNNNWLLPGIEMTRLTLARTATIGCIAVTGYAEAS